jgi:hypothetical protein
MNSMKNPAFTGSKNGWRTSHFLARKHEFGALNSEFSVHVFTGSARDALTQAASTSNLKTQLMRHH